MKSDWEALSDSFPICLSFFFVFSAIGALSKSVNTGLINSAAMSLIIHAAPLQAILLVLIKNQDKSLLLCVLISFFVNFRFLIFSFALKNHLKNTKFYKALFVMFLLNTSVFTVCHAKFKENIIVNKTRYFIILALPTILVSVLATMFGYLFFNPNNAFISVVVSMMLPIHFAGITSKSLNKLNYVLATLIGFLSYPVFYSYAGIYSFVLCPALFALILTSLHNIKEEKYVSRLNA